MTLKPLHGLFVALALAAAAPYALAADYSADLKKGTLGSSAQATAAQKTVKITAATKYVTIQHLDTVKFENDKGQSFVWNFSMRQALNFPLKAIAPANFAAGETWVYTSHDAGHFKTETN